MKEFLDALAKHEEIVEQLAVMIEEHTSYQSELKQYLPSLTQLIQTILQIGNGSQFSLELNQEFVLQILSDIVYGIEHEDDVFLLDVLRYGLLELYDYIGTELQRKSSYE